MEKLLKEYKENKVFLENTLQMILNQLKFHELIYQEKSKNQIKFKILKKDLEDGVEITAKEVVYKNSKNQNVIIDKYYNKKDYDRYIIHSNEERISLDCEKYKSNQLIKLSKQYTQNGQIITTYLSQNKLDILHQNMSSEIMYLENFKKNQLGVNLFSNKEEIKYISSFPYEFAYESVVLGNLENEETLTKKFESINHKRKAIDANLLSINVDNQKEVQKQIEKINLIIFQAKNLISDFNEIVNLIKINKEEGKEILEEKEEQQNEISELEMLKNERKEFQELEIKTFEMIEKLTNVLENKNA